MEVPEIRFNPGVDLAGPGIYMWQIDGRPVYVGQCSSIHRRRRDYVRNVRNIQSGKPYRGGNPDGFRAIHRQLADAVGRHAIIELRFIENVPEKSLRNSREHAWQTFYGLKDSTP